MGLKNALHVKSLGCQVRDTLNGVTAKAGFRITIIKMSSVAVTVLQCLQVMVAMDAQSATLQYLFHLTRVGNRLNNKWYAFIFNSMSYVFQTF